MMNEYKVISHVTGEVFAVLVIETEMSFYAKKIDKDPHTLPHRKSLESRMNTEYNKYPTSGVMTQMAALELFGLVWIGENKKVKA
jgi:hypothetical protein